MMACSSHLLAHTLLFSQKWQKPEQKCSFEQGVEAHLYSVKHQNSVGQKKFFLRSRGCKVYSELNPVL